MPVFLEKNGHERVHLPLAKKKKILVAICFGVNNCNALLNWNCLVLFLREKSENSWRLEEPKYKVFCSVLILCIRKRLLALDKEWIQD